MPPLPPDDRAPAIGEARAGGVFASTEWTVVLAARERTTEASREALERLCRTYWQPVYTFIRRRGRSPHDAEDLTQAFFAHVLAGGFLDAVARERGRFRCFLLASLRNFLVNQHERVSAAKRGGRVQIVAIDEAVAEQRSALADENQDDPSLGFDRQWAVTVLEEALRALEAEQRTAGRARQFERLRPFLRDWPARGRYEEAAADLGVSRGAVAVTVHRLVRRYRELLRAEVARTVETRAEIEDELRELLGRL